MKVQWDQISDRARKRAAAALALIAAAGALCAGLVLPGRQFDAPRVPETPPAIVQVLEEAPAAVLPDEPEADAREKRRLRHRKAVSAVQAALSYLLGAALRVLTFLLTALVSRLLGAPLATLAAFLGDILVTCLLMLLLFSWIFRRLFPGRRLGDFLTVKNLLLMLAGALAISVVRLLLQRAGGIPGAIAAFADSFSGVLLFCATFLLICRTGFARGETAKKLTRRLLFSRPVAIAFAVLVLLSALSALIRIFAPVAGQIKALLSFTMLFLLCFAAAAFLVSRKIPIRLPEAAS